MTSCGYAAIARQRGRWGDTGRVTARRRIATLALAALLALFAACGGDSEEETTTPAPPAEGPGRPEPDTADADAGDVEVIEAWSDALREGDVETAAGFFALPSVAENGPQLVRIRDRDDARLFNRSLPCGAVLVAAESEGAFTTATFELTERSGPGRCGPGAGEEAQTAFVIEAGEIVEWRRVGLGEEPAPGEAV
jgi:hypothetical protein